MKISITNLLNRRKKFNAMLLVAVLFLSAFLLSIAATKNPNGTKAAAPIPPAGATCDPTPDGDGIYSCEITGGTPSVPFVLPANTLDNTNLTISGIPGTSAYVVSTGLHHFNNVTMKQGARVTTAFLSATTNSMAQETEKQVNWIIEKKLTMSDWSSFYVDRDGYWGGAVDLVTPARGPAPGSLMSVVATDCAGGGGGLGGNGQNGLARLSPVVALGGIFAGSNIDTIDRGSGGGAASCNGTTRVGQAGAGIIDIWAKEEIIKMETSGFYARGSATGATVTTGGGGAGGTIRLTTNVFSSDNLNSANIGPNVSGGKSGADVAPSGITNVAPPSPAFYNISANGGSSSVNGYGGGGGGGIVKITYNSLNFFCYLKSGTAIPAICENRDVVIDGDTNDDGIAEGITIDMGEEKVFQTGANAGQQCNAQNDSNCDSKRHFKSLKLINKAVLTHSGLLASEILGPAGDGVNKQDLNNNGSLADETVGSARWKKVDIAVDNKITFESRAKIDVTGKGYPGAYYSWYTVYAGYVLDDRRGCNGNTMGRLIGSLGASTKSDTAYRKNYGFGPKISATEWSGGAAYNEYDYSSGGGGGAGGNGKVGTGDTNGSKKYDYMNGAGQEWGAGGGASGYDGGGDDTSCSEGGNGGGRVTLSADSIDFNLTFSGADTGGIYADGEIGYLFMNDGCSVGAGGGAGGSIVIRTNAISYGGMTSFYGINVEGGTFDGEQGVYEVNGIANNTLYQMSARGGDRSLLYRPTDGRGGGGGWIVVNPTSPTSSSVRKVLIPISRSGLSPANNFNPYSLQLNDTIQVWVMVSNLVPNSSNLITDELYKSTDNRQFCEPIALTSTVPYVDPTFSDGTVKFNATADALGDISNLHYNCLVKSY